MPFETDEDGPAASTAKSLDSARSGIVTAPRTESTPGEAKPQLVASKAELPSETTEPTQGLPVELAEEAKSDPTANTSGRQSNFVQPVSPREDANVVKVSEAIQALAQAETETEGDDQASMKAVRATDKPESTQAPELAKADRGKPAVPDQEPRNLKVSNQDTSRLDAKMAEVLAAEDELAEMEHERSEKMDRQRSLDEARIRTLVDQKAASTSGGSMGGNLGRESGSRDSFSGRAPLSSLSAAQPSSAPPVAAFATQLEQAQNTKAPQSVEQPRKIAQAILEQAKELSKSRRVDLDKMNLTIRLDESSEVKLRFTPRGDGTHELAFLVSDSKLKDELRRALPEIRDAATELPLTITDILFGDTLGDDLQSVEDFDPSTRR